MNRGSLARAFRQISGMTGISRILGFGRDVVFAAFLGAGPAADAFLVALKLPNMFRRLTAEGALANAFVPAFSAMRRDQGDAAATRLAAETQTTLMMVLLAIVGLAEFFMPAIITVLAPGFTNTPERFDTAVTLARVTFPYMPMISLVAFWAAIANANGRFLAAAAMPIIFNLFLIVGALAIPLATGWLAVEQAMPLAVALLATGFVQLAVMGAVLVRSRSMPGICRPQFGAPIRAMWRQFTVASAGAIILQINLIVDLVLASLLPMGAIAWLYYADRVAQLPLGVIGVALATALLPRLSAQFRERDYAAARSALAEAVVFAAFLIMPATVALILIAPQIVTGLFAHGAFTMADADHSAAALMAYAMGLPAHIMVKLVQPAFYANSRAGFVLAVSIVTVTVNIGLSLTLMPIFGHVGLALATSVSGYVAAAIIVSGLIRSNHFGMPSSAALGRIVIATLAMAAALFSLIYGVPGLISALGSVGGLALLVASGGTVFLLVAWRIGAIPAQLLRR